jgi:lipopolysaccharide biosynthesis protein
MKPLVAVCFHLGYFDRFEQFTPYIDRVAHCCHIDLYMTYREDQDPTAMCHAKYPKAVIIKAIRGCDTGAFLLQIKAMIDSHKTYDYVFKLHTKSNNPIFQNWKDELLNPIAGGQHQVREILESFRKHRGIGMIGAKKWILKRDINSTIFNDLCQRLRIHPEGHFVGGTIFWIRFSVLVRCAQFINLDAEYERCELGKPSEPSYTHSWERLLGLMVTTCDMTIKGVR